LAAPTTPSIEDDAFSSFSLNSFDFFLDPALTLLAV